MSIGALVRKLVGRHERSLCAVYRGIFVNLDRAAEQLAPHFPKNASIVDVGGGDGEMLNRLLHLRPDLKITMVDLQARMGAFLDTHTDGKVAKLPGTSLAQYRTISGADADVVFLSDVVHHVPVKERPSFIRDAKAILKPGGRLIIKEVAPGGLISWLAIMADRHISGDKNVVFFTPSELIQLVEKEAGMTMPQSLLSEREHPNYALSFQ